jgi:hypothetical protein
MYGNRVGQTHLTVEQHGYVSAWKRSVRVHQIDVRRSVKLSNAVENRRIEKSSSRREAPASRQRPESHALGGRRLRMRCPTRAIPRRHGQYRVLHAVICSRHQRFGDKASPSVIVDGGIERRKRQDMQSPVRALRGGCGMGVVHGSLRAKRCAIMVATTLNTRRFNGSAPLPPADRATASGGVPRDPGK